MGDDGAASLRSGNVPSGGIDGSSPCCLPRPWNTLIFHCIAATVVFLPASPHPHLGGVIGGGFTGWGEACTQLYFLLAVVMDTLLAVTYLTHVATPLEVKLKASILNRENQQVGGDAHVEGEGGSGSVGHQCMRIYLWVKPHRDRFFSLLFCMNTAICFGYWFILKPVLDSTPYDVDLSHWGEWKNIIVHGATGLLSWIEVVINPIDPVRWWGRSYMLPEVALIFAISVYYCLTDALGGHMTLEYTYGIEGAEGKNLYFECAILFFGQLIVMTIMHSLPFVIHRIRTSRCPNRNYPLINTPAEQRVRRNLDVDKCRGECVWVLFASWMVATFILVASLLAPITLGETEHLLLVTVEGKEVASPFWSDMFTSERVWSQTGLIQSSLPLSSLDRVNCVGGDGGEVSNCVLINHYLWSFGELSQPDAPSNPKNHQVVVAVSTALANMTRVTATATLLPTSASIPHAHWENKGFVVTSFVENLSVEQQQQLATFKVIDNDFWGTYNASGVCGIHLDVGSGGNFTLTLERLYSDVPSPIQSPDSVIVVGEYAYAYFPGCDPSDAWKVCLGRTSAQLVTRPNPPFQLLSDDMKTYISETAVSRTGNVATVPSGQISVKYFKDLKIFVMAYAGFINRKIMIRLAKEVDGPWSDELVGFERPGSVGEGFQGVLKNVCLHPELSGANYVAVSYHILGHNLPYMAEITLNLTTHVPQ